MSKAKPKGMFVDAHPTAPGGMSQKALGKELIERHGWAPEKVKPLLVATEWPRLIETVAQERLLREREVLSETVKDEYSELMAEYEEAAAARKQRAAEPPAPAKPALFLGMPDTLDFIFDGHAGTGPSGAERWMNCTMSLGASRAFLETLTPNQQEAFAQSGTAARQGTTAHTAAEAEANVMLGVISAEEADQTLLELAVMPDDEAEAYTPEMAEYISEYLDLVKTYVDTGYEVTVEQRVIAVIPLAGDHEGDVYEEPGTADLTAYNQATKDLAVVDLKYGENIDVSVERNPQVRIYALGVLSALADDEGQLPDIDTITYQIVQPRLGGIKTWSESLDDLLDWRDDVLSPALTAALYGEAAGAVFAPTDEACQWCPARGACPALAESRVTQAAELFDTIVEAEFDGEPGAFPETTSLSNDRLGALYSQIRGLTDILSDLKEEAQRRLHRGEKIPGFQLVSYTPPRKWTEDAPEKLAGNKALWKEPTLVTPTAALKLLGEKAGQIEDLIDAPDKRPVIAPEGDRRKTWEGRPPEQMFPEIGDE